MTPPSTIAHYRTTSKLGEGGMGAVYRATDIKLNRGWLARPANRRYPPLMSILVVKGA